MFGATLPAGGAKLRRLKAPFSPTLAESLEQRQNNYQILRFVAASLDIMFGLAARAQTRSLMFEPRSAPEKSSLAQMLASQNISARFLR
jgi:hypothetical protein